MLFTFTVSEEYMMYNNDNYVEEFDLSDTSQKWSPEILCVVCLKEKMPLRYLSHVDMRTVVEIAVTCWNKRISAAQHAVLKLIVNSNYFDLMLTFFFRPSTFLAILFD